MNSVTSNPPTLAYALRREIQSFSLDGQDSRSVVGGLRNAIALDYLYVNESCYRLFWSDLAEHTIRTARVVNGTITNTTTLVSNGIGTVEGLAVDWIGNNVYFADSTFAHIDVISLNDWSGRVTIVDEDVGNLRALACDAIRGGTFRRKS